MSLIDGIAGLFGAVFPSVMPAGTLHRSMRTDSAAGRVTLSFADEPIYVQKDRTTQAMRGAEGYVETDVALIVLASGIDRPSTQDEITAGDGVRYTIASIDIDPASSHWIIRGQRK